MTLISIDEHDRRKQEILKHKNATGVACPHCGEELQKEGRGVLLSYPAQQPVICYGCDYHTTILA